MIERLIVAAVMCLALTACGGGSNPDLAAEKLIPDNQKVGDNRAEIISGADTLTFDQGNLAGTGSVRFAALLSGPDTANNFTLDFELSDQGSLVLVTNSNQSLGLGLEVEFKRSGNALNVVARGGSDVFDMSQFFTAINASVRLKFSIDVHNDHGAVTHILIWDENNQSIELVDDILNGKGFGPYWGLRLSQAKVLSGGRADPRDVH